MHVNRDADKSQAGGLKPRRERESTADSERCDVSDSGLPN